ncbi:three-Cys-motif partner protein TcmP [Nocardia sp. NPDC019395]|uniref:three-Cys-motif partner protein TcmP n=1 Tax=Nocardia sp. NPDC019395 TaxID=3154686 RepID=UPI0033C43655
MNNFHKTKKSAAVLKHAILDQYATPFASKTGRWSTGNRVVFIDGYAGPGRYEDGEEGSGAMLLRKAREMAHFPRRIECHFVESDPETVDRLKAVATAEGADVDYTIYDDDISTHLPELLQSAEGIPLFTYLDPCGLVIPLDEVASIFQRPGGYGSPATEVLINLTAHVRRFAGMLYSATPMEGSLQRMDGVCGGDWWRETWLEKCPTKDASEDDKMAAEQAVVEGYARELCKCAGVAGSWIIDVRPRADLKPVYYLVFATRHMDGMVTFGESASLGLQRWREYLAEVSAQDTLFGSAAEWKDEWKKQENVLKAQWIETIANGITEELAKGEPFRLIERPSVLGGLGGVARTLHFRAAIKKVLLAGKTTTDPKGAEDLWNLSIRPA